MKKINIIDLRAKLSELKNEAVVAQTKEQMLVDEKQKILSDIQSLFVELEKLNLFTKEELVPNNLSTIVEKLYSHIEKEVVQCNIPGVHL